MTIEPFLIIRDEQLKILEEAQFENWLVKHLKKFFPDVCQKLDEPEIRERIQHGFKQAAFYCFDDRVHIMQFIDLMFVFGRDFDADPDLPWASSVLKDENNYGAEFKMDQLFENAMDTL
jgi:hypothetical protein